MSTPQDLAALVAAGRATRSDMDLLGRDRVAAIKTNPEIPQFRVRANDPISVNEDRRTISYIASDETPDRMGDIIRVKGWDLANYKKNPVILWAHDGKAVPPIGRANNVRRRYGPARLTADIEFAPAEAHEFAETIYQLASRGFIRATSVGFLPVETEDVDEKTRDALGIGPYGQVFSASELMEISVVAVPANPSALQDGVKALTAEGSFDSGKVARFFDTYPASESIALSRVRAACRSFVDFGAVTRMALPPHKTPKAAADQAWDADAVWKGINDNYEGEERAARFRLVSAYMVSEADPETRGAWKFPHHDVDGDVVWHGIAAAMAALNGARGGGSDLSEKDREGIYRHLEAHYKQFDKEPPERRSVEELEAPEGVAPEAKSPACRMDGEAVKECVARKVPELIEEGMEQDQAVAAANSMCEDACGEKDAPALETKDVDKLRDALSYLAKAFKMIEEAVAEYGGEESPDAPEPEDDEMDETDEYSRGADTRSMDAVATLIENQAEHTRATRQLVDALSDLTVRLHGQAHDGVDGGGTRVQPDADTPEVMEPDAQEIEGLVESVSRGFAERVRRDFFQRNGKPQERT